ncbi:ATP-binding protein [Streptomyces sp. NPDC050803]|uniref:ATP-binding protein n=1 Tax=unclassified Streptomyces TaxID=2593676 RepID=UPI0034329EFD
MAATAAVVGFGALSESMAFGWGRPGRWAPDLLVGAVFAGAACWVWPRARGAAGLLAATSVAWFAANVLPDAGLFWHRGTLIHLLLACPGALPRSRLAWGGAGVGYLASVGAWWRFDTVTVALSVALVCLLLYEHTRADTGRARHSGTALWAGTAFGAALAAGAVARLVMGPSSGAAPPTLWLYEAALCVVAVLLARGVRVRSEPAAVTDLVVELGEHRSGLLRDALARTLGDDSLEVGYWQPDHGRYVDLAGRPVSLPDAADGRTAHRIERDGRPFAVLVHDPAVLDDPALVAAVEAATRLTASHAALHAEVRGRIAEVRASRRRLVLAADEERRDLERRLHEGPQRRLAALRAALRSLDTDPDAPQAAALARTCDHLEHTIEALRTLALGLHPRELEGGLSSALETLAARQPLPVRLDVPAERFADESEAAVYYLVAEALTNVAKHARASRAEVAVRRADESVVVTVRDDGAGGADPERGSGLKGLADRVEALGGTLALVSGPGAGTTLSARIPLSRR